MTIWLWSLILLAGIVGFLAARYPELRAAWKAKRDPEASLALRRAADILAGEVLVRESIFVGSVRDLMLRADGRRSCNAVGKGSAPQAAAFLLSTAAATKAADPDGWRIDPDVRRSVHEAFTVLQTISLTARLSLARGELEAHAHAKGEQELDRAFVLAVHAAVGERERIKTLSESLITKTLRFGRCSMDRNELRRFLQDNPLTSDDGVEAAQAPAPRPVVRGRPRKGHLRLVDKDYAPEDK